MKSTYEGIGQWAATFSCGSGVAEGEVVKISGNGAVAVCSAGEGFAGVVIAVGHDDAACSVALGGIAAVTYTETAPTLGWNTFVADGAGGVKTSETGRDYLVVDVDSTAKTVAFVL